MKLITLLLFSITLGFYPTLTAQQSIAEIQAEVDQIKSEGGALSFEYAEKLLELSQAYQSEQKFKKAALLDQDVTLILKHFSDSIPGDYEIEYAISEQLETVRLEQYFTRWQGLVLQEKYATAQQIIIKKDWIERSIKAKRYLDVINFFQVAHKTIGSQHPDYLENWTAAYFTYTSPTYYNLQQTQNLWKAITLHRATETKEDSPAHIEVLYGYASFSDRTNDTETYEKLKPRIEKIWPAAFGNYAALAKDSQNSSSDKKTAPAPEKTKKKDPATRKDHLTTPSPEEDIYTLVEQMPRFPGCETLVGDDQAKKACADQRLLGFIYKKIRYPNIARENGIEGMAVVSFTVTEYGTIVDLKILRDPGGACGQEASRVMQLMNELPSRWTPGRQRGKNVRVKYNLPVRFKLN